MPARSGMSQVLGPEAAYAEALGRIENARMRRARTLSLADLISLHELPEEIRSLLFLQSLSLGSFLRGTRLTSIELLRHLPRLQRLHLGRTPIADITPLSELRNLRALYLSDTKVSDLRPLSPLSKLERLNLYGARVSDLWAISFLPNLHHLDIRRSAVFDLAPLARTISLVRGARMDRRNGLIFTKDKIGDPAIRALASLPNPQRTREVIKLLRRQQGLRALGRYDMPPNDHEFPRFRARMLQEFGFTQDALGILEDAVADDPFDQRLRAERDQLLGALLDQTTREEVAAEDDAADEVAPPIESIPGPERRAIQFNSPNDGPIDLAPLSEPGERLQDGPGQREDYAELRSKAMELKALGPNRLGRVDAPIRRFLLLTEEMTQVRLKVFWSRMNTLRIILNDHEKVAQAQHHEPDDRVLEPLTVSHLKDLVESLNVFVIGDPGLMELDSSRPGPQDIEVAKAELGEVETVIDDLNSHPEIASDMAREVLNEQVGNIERSDSDLASRQGADFGRRSIRNFIGELLRHTYRRARDEVVDGTKLVREAAYKSVGAVVGVAAAAGVAVAATAFISFVTTHAAALSAYAMKAFNNPAIGKIIEWISQLHF
jgi:hypothetical protein